MKFLRALGKKKKIYSVAGLLLLGFISLVVIILGWLSRGDWIYPEQLNASLTLELPAEGDKSVGQTFVADQSGLQGIGVRIHFSESARDRKLQLLLFDGMEAQQSPIEAIASTQGLQDGEFVYFKFEPLPDSRHHYYYFTLHSLDAASEHAIAFYGGPLESYVNGAAYENGVPLDAQMAFHLNYSRALMLRDFIQRLAFGIPAALAALMMLIIPGAIVLVWFRPPLELDFIEWTAIAIGTSLAFYPTALYLLRYTPIRLSGFSVWIIFAVLSLVLLAGLWRRCREKTCKLTTLAAGIPISPAFIAFWLIFGLSLAVRLQVISGVEIPFWADSYHHTIISRLIVDNGRVPNNWEPYAPMQSMNYHFGFHTMVAVFHWLTGLAAPKSVLFFGQILNALAVLMAYLLGRRFGGNAWVGVFAALIVGLISKYPMYYVNWGRYTQLAGQIFLPVLAVFTWQLLREKRRDKIIIAFNSLLIVALFLTHYRVILFYPAFVAPLVFIRWYQAGWKKTVIVEDVIRLTITGGFAAALLLPRLLELIGSKLWVVNANIAKMGMKHQYTRQVLNATPNLFDFLPPWVILGGWLGWGIGSWKRKPGIFVFGGWWLALMLITNPHFVGLPGSGPITNFAILIGAYMIFSVLGGYLLGKMVQVGERLWQPVTWVLLPIIIGVALWGSFQQWQILDTSGMLVTPPDLRAMTWIEKNLPEKAEFVINSRLAYGGSMVVAGDAGWWLPFLTGRRTAVPPMVYGLEDPPYLHSLEHPKDVYFALGLDTPDLSAYDLRQQMKALGLEYIYIGQQRGRVWQDGGKLIDPDRIARSSVWKTIYAEDGVRIFQTQ